MPGELVILNEQLQILFPICDEIGIIIQQVKYYYFSKRIKTLDKLSKISYNKNIARIKNIGG